MASTSDRTASALDDGGLRSDDDEAGVAADLQDPHDPSDEVIDEEGPAITAAEPFARVGEAEVEVVYGDSFEEPGLGDKEAAVLRAALAHWREVARRRGLRREAVHALKRADRSGILSRTFHHWSSSASSSRAGSACSRESSQADPSPRLASRASLFLSPPQQHQHHRLDEAPASFQHHRPSSFRSPINHPSRPSPAPDHRGAARMTSPHRRHSADTVELRGLVGGLSYPPSWHPRNNPPKPAERPGPSGGPPAYFEPTVSFLLKTSDDFHRFRPNPNHPYNRVETQRKRFDKMVSTYWYQDDFLARQRLAELVNQKLGL